MFFDFADDLEIIAHVPIGHKADHPDVVLLSGWPVGLIERGADGFHHLRAPIGTRGEPAPGAGSPALPVLAKEITDPQERAEITEQTERLNPFRLFRYFRLFRDLSYCYDLKSITERPVSDSIIQGEL
jgi:hypothetical protein